MGKRAMAEHNFTLTIQGTYSDAVLDALFEAGCDDATISHKGELIFAEFDREADSLLDAVLTAIADVESVAGLAALHVAPDDLVWASEIAERLGRTRQSVDLLIKGHRGPGGFPAPASHATRNPLWRWSDVEAWFERYDGRPADAERSAVLGAINGALQARHSARSSHDEKQLVDAVQHLVAS